ncbi:MAG: type II toxin-antitoxin system RelE/ParE family toxin [Magnetococcales bacterium]|nr:type II toxin-antitoxin system RelE/ParE family toxin [Magnetococcales bacterium]
MRFTVDLQLVRKTLDRLSPEMRRQILYAAMTLEADPHPPGSLKLQGLDDVWRLRVGDYRILYTVEEEQVRILLLKIAHRREVYRGLP